MSVKIKKQCIVLLSGGLDSSTVLNIALENYDVTALIFDYGQRHKFEISAAKKIAGFVDIPIKLITIDLGQFGNSALTDNIEVPKNQDIGKEIPITYVPVRNTIFLSYALAYAEVNNIFDIFIGVNALDYSGYPDCRPEFIEAFEKMANEGTKFAQGNKKIKIHARSIFLQGLLLCSHSNLPSKFKNNRFFLEWFKWLKINNYDPLDVSLRFIKDIKYVDKIVIGVDNFSQLDNIVKSYKKNFKIKFKKFIQSQLLKNPSTW